MITAQRKAAVPFRDYSYLPLPFKLPSFRFHGTRKLEYQRTGSFFKQQENILVSDNNHASVTNFILLSIAISATSSA